MSVDMERVREHLKSLLVNDMPIILKEIDAEKETELTTPSPVVYLDYPVLEESNVVFPVGLVYTRRANKIDGIEADNFDVEVTRQYHLDIEFWYNSYNPDEVKVYIERAARAGCKILENGENWGALGMWDPQVDDIMFAETHDQEYAYMRVCRLIFNVKGTETVV